MKLTARMWREKPDPQGPKHGGIDLTHWNSRSNLEKAGQGGLGQGQLCL